MRSGMLKGICLAGWLTLWSICFLWSEGSAATYQQWLKYSEAVKKDPSVIRYYIFDELKDMKVRNLAGDTGYLVFMDAKAKPGEPFAEEWKTVPGRWPEKKAAWLDQSSLLDNAYGGDTGKFTFECWVRFMDYGKYQASGKLGTIVTVGNGYTGGWRIFIGGPSRNVCFEIGSMNPPGGAYLTGGLLAPDVWQHVAVTWDGETACTYVNGSPVGTKKWNQPYVPDKNLVIGYSGYGTGSIKMEIDEAIVYSRALTAEEIVRHFNLQP